jgi:hypothetical protein
MAFPVRAAIFKAVQNGKKGGLADGFGAQR